MTALMIRKLHHIGIAVRSLDEALPHYRDGLGLPFEGIEDVPSEQVRVAMLTLGESRIELLEPTADESPIAKFLEKRGPGVHHLAFEVESAQEIVEVLLDGGAPIIGDAPREGAHGTQVAFLHPRYLGGVLAELVEVPK